MMNHMLCKAEEMKSDNFIKELKFFSVGFEKAEFIKFNRLSNLIVEHNLSFINPLIYQMHASKLILMSKNLS